MDIKISGHEFNYDITSMSMLFFPGEKVDYVNRSRKNTHIISSLKVRNDGYISITKIKYNGKWFSCQKTAQADVDAKNLVKQTFYKACTKATGITSPWGILTGIRPLSVYSKVAVQTSKNKTMSDEYFLSESKIALLDLIYHNQMTLDESQDRDVSIYISIPFCPSKCSYCSFVSVAATNKPEMQKRYLDNLIKEIKLKSNIINKYDLNIKSLYIGGGTPGVLTEGSLKTLLEYLNNKFDFSKIGEISFEIGRPETVTDEKLAILKKLGVGRLCINTQTTNDIVLANVNRKHLSADYFRAVKMAQKYNFGSINTDLIAGLPTESYESFCKSVVDVISTGVDNITIHTLSIKRAAVLSDKNENYNPSNNIVIRMLDYAYDCLSKAGFSPYYIYRQKNCVSNGENVGFCKNGNMCKYNIYMMEDKHSVLACGAGASTKIIKDGIVERVINVKYPMEYNSEFERIIANNSRVNKILKENFKND